MCVSCVSNAEVVLSQAVLVGALAKRPVHRLLARFDLVAPPDPHAGDRRTVAFLRSLDLDPLDVLGADVVAAAEASVPYVRARARASARPIGSHSLLTAQ